ncbi:MAG: hypothetical protein AAGG07_12435 [Planctomycetota bacterium]
MRVGLVNCRVLPEPDPDEAPLLAALRDAGHEAEPVAWDDPKADPESFDVLALRATWNYPQDTDGFLEWVGSPAAEGRLVNASELVEWNIDKRYLAELAEAGVPVVPTAFPEEDTDLVALCSEQGWDEVVVKPVIGAGSMMTRRFEKGQLAEAAEYFTEASASREMMVQPLVPEVETEGERSVVVIGGSISHGVHKSPRFEGQTETVKAAGVDADMRGLVKKILDRCPVTPVYARVDLFPDGKGGWMLSELELIEPSLYFDLGPGSALRMVRALERAVR